MLDNAKEDLNVMLVTDTGSTRTTAPLPLSSPSLFRSGRELAMCSAHPHLCTLLSLLSVCIVDHHTTSCAQDSKQTNKKAYGNYFGCKQTLSHSSVPREGRETAGGPLQQLCAQAQWEVTQGGGWQPEPPEQPLQHMLVVGSSAANSCRKLRLSG